MAQESRDGGRVARPSLKRPPPGELRPLGLSTPLIVTGPLAIVSVDVVGLLMLLILLILLMLLLLLLWSPSHASLEIATQRSDVRSPHRRTVRYSELYWSKPAGS